MCRGLILFFLFSVLEGANGHADEIRDDLRKATESYEAEIAGLEDDVKGYFQSLIDQYQAEGDLEKTLAIKELKEQFMAEGILQDLPAHRSFRQKVKLRYAQINREFRTAHLRAISAYTKSNELAAALEVRRSLDAFEANSDEGVIVFPRADRKVPAAAPQWSPSSEAPAIGAERPGNAADAMDSAVSSEEISDTLDAVEPMPGPDETASDVRARRMARARAAQGRAAPRVQIQSKTFDYSTNDGVCNVGEGEMKFGLEFSSCGANSIYLYNDDSSVRRVASVRGAWPGAVLRFVDFDSTSRAYEINEKQVFLAENEAGYYMIGRIVRVDNIDRGDAGDLILFDYIINDVKGDDRLIAPPLR